MNIKHLLGMAVIAVSSFVSGKAAAQGMAVNTTGTAAATSAVLDVSSTTQGMLVPRMDSAQRSLIATPATGLLVYQTNGVTPGFYFYNGSAWASLSGGAPSGAAGGDLTGTYPNPTIAASGVTTAKINDGAVTTAKIATTGATTGQVLSYDGTNVAWATPAGGAPSGAAGGDLSGTYPNPTVANSTITSAKILDGTIVNSDVSSTAAIAYSKLNLLSSVASTDLAANAVTTGKIADAAVTTAKIADSVVTIAKLSKTGAASGQVIGFDGSTVAWTTPSGGGGGLGTLQFSGTGPGFATGTTANIATPITFGTTTATNVSGQMATGTGIFKATAAGNYFIVFNSNIALASVTINMIVWTEVNGVRKAGHFGAANYTNNTTGFVTFTDVMTLNANDEVRFFFTVNAGASQNYNGTNLQIYKM